MALRGATLCSQWEPSLMCELQAHLDTIYECAQRLVKTCVSINECFVFSNFSNHHFLRNCCIYPYDFLEIIVTITRSDQKVKNIRRILRKFYGNFVRNRETVVEILWLCKKILPYLTAFERNATEKNLKNFVTLKNFRKVLGKS